MARHSAINPVAEAVVTALNVASLRALAPGGVYRNRPTAQQPPFVSVGPCHEEPDDTMGRYGAIVTVPIHALTTGADANGESRCAGILEQIVALIEPPAVLTVTGLTVRYVKYLSMGIGSDDRLLATTGDASGIDGVAQFEIAVWST
jgi:hypothetical protein